MTVSSIINRLKELIPIWMRLLYEAYSYWMSLIRYNASIRTDRDLLKMQYTLLRENHVIEKGMSMPHPRPGFGQMKVMALMTRLSKYFQRYGHNDKDFLFYPLATIKQYIEFTEQSGVQIPQLKERYDVLLRQVDLSPEQIQTPAGIRYVAGSEIQEAATGNFEALLYSRHSIRHFEKQVPNKDLIIKALQMAAQTPSACNRQAWHTHVFTNHQCHRLLEMQGGCSGFTDVIHCAIVVTADKKGFLAYEPFQCYVDGGLYAMNLINACHALGLGTIPLSLGFYRSQLRKIHRTFDIPFNEALIVMIGVGVLPETVKIAQSTRKDIVLTNTFHTESNESPS